MLAAFVLAPGFAAAEGGNPELVLKLARFGTWPSDGAPGLSFRICLRDDDPAFGEFLRLKGREVGGRPVTLHGISPRAFGRRPCHVAYFSNGLADATIIEALRDQPVLTVSTQPGFARSGGLVELSSASGETVLLIRRETVIGHPLTLSAQLLDMASEVPR